MNILLRENVYRVSVPGPGYVFREHSMSCTEGTSYLTAVGPRNSFHAVILLARLRDRGATIRIIAALKAGLVRRYDDLHVVLVSNANASAWVAPLARIILTAFVFGVQAIKWF